MKKIKLFIVVLMVCLIGLLTLHSVFALCKVKTIQVPFEREDITSISLKGISENTTNKTKTIEDESKIDEIWIFLQSLEESSESSVEEVMGGAGYSVEFILADQSTYEIIFWKDRTVGNALIYSVYMEDGNKTAISTIDLEDYFQAKK